MIDRPRSRSRIYTDEDRRIVNREYAPRPRGIIPETLIDAAPTYCIKVNAFWLAHILGVVFALDESDAWAGNFNEREFARSEVRRLIASIAPCEEGFLMPCYVGMIVSGMWWDEVPDGLLPADGSTHLKADYPELWDTLNQSPLPGHYEISDTEFRTPNRDGTFGVAFDDTADFQGVGYIGGERKHALTAGENAPHTHAMQYNVYTGSGQHGALSGSENLRAFVNLNVPMSATQSSGSGTPHNNLPPYHVERFCIVARCQTVTSSFSFRLRQNPLDKCLMEQSFNGGETWLPAFDYSLCDNGPQITFGDVTTGQTEINNIVNLYDGDVLNISPDLQYGDANDGLRDDALCFGLGVFLDAFYRSIISAIENAKETSDPNGTQIASWALQAVSIGIGIAAGFGLVTIPVALIYGAGSALGALIADIIGATSGEDEIETDPDYDLSDWQCCLYGELSGETISQARFATAIAACPVPTDIPGYEVIQLAWTNAALSVPVFASFVSILAEINDAALDGVMLPCPCNPGDCVDVDFRTSSDAEPFTPFNACSFVEEVGVIGNSNNGTGDTTAGDGASVRLEWSEPVIVTSVRVVWRRPRTAGGGATGTALSVVDASGGGYYEIANVGPVGGVAGTTEDHTFEIERAMDTLAIYANGSKFNLKIGLIYQVVVCWQGAGVPI